MVFFRNVTKKQELNLYLWLNGGGQTEKEGVVRKFCPTLFPGLWYTIEKERKGEGPVYKICHSEESSRRQRELEQGLLAAMERLPYARITLTELCRELQVPRKTFYRYFPTKDDCLLALIDHTLADCNDVALTGWSGRALDDQAQLRFFPVLDGSPGAAGCAAQQRHAGASSGADHSDRGPDEGKCAPSLLCTGSGGVFHCPRPDDHGAAVASVWIPEHTGGDGESL